MTIQNIWVADVGASGMQPRTVKLLCTDSYTDVITAGFISAELQQNYQLMQNDIVEVSYGNPSTSVVLLKPSIDASTKVVTLNPISEGNVALPVVSNHFANFSGTGGLLADAGYSPSDPAKTKVVMANAATIINHLVVAADTAGTIKDTAGVTAIAGSNIQAGLTTGTAGSLTSCPGTTTTGTLSLTAVANSGNYANVISNALTGQATTWSLPDPGTATTTVLLANNATTQTIATGNLAVAAGNITATTGNLIAGSSAHAGTVSSFPSSATSGSLILAAVNSAGNFNVTISNRSFAQATVFSIGDPGAATASILTSLVNADVGSNLITFNVTCGFAALATGGSVTLYASSGSKQYRVISLRINAGGTNFSGGGGDRLGQVTDGTTAYSIIPATNMQTLINSLWGVSTPLPFPASSVSAATLTAAGASLVFKYSGGGTDYTAGSIVVSGTLERIA